MKRVVLSTAYLPPIAYFQAIGDYSFILFEKEEFYQKQSYRNRTYILSASGIQILTIPVLQNHTKTCIKDIKIDYKIPWQRTHLRSIQSAYNNSPFFLYYQDYFIPFYEKKEVFLFDFNHKLIDVICKLLSWNPHFDFTTTYNDTYSGDTDLRKIIHPKNELPSPSFIKPYTQVFSSKFGFTVSLSIIDLLFNEGPLATSFLHPDREN